MERLPLDRLPLLAKRTGGMLCAIGLGLGLLFFATPANGQGSSFYDSWAGQVGGGPDSAWGVENLTDPNNGNVHYTNITPSESSASNPTTLQVINDSSSPTGRALQMTIVPKGNGVYDSAEVSTRLGGAPGNNIEYGQIEASIKVAGGPGTGADSVWPAFWMLGDNISSVGWPPCGEIDIMETKGSNETTNYMHIHGPVPPSNGDYNGSSGVGGTYTLPNGAYMYSGYNTYAINWSPNQITWLVNGVACLTETPTSSNFVSTGGNWVFNGHPFYLIFDICQGGPFAGTGNNLTQPLNMDIAYVSVTTSPSAASSYWWNAGSGVWGAAPNWWTTSGGSTAFSPPGATNDAVFNGNGVNGPITVSLTGSTLIQGLIFSNTGATTLQSANAATNLLSIGTDGIVVQGGAGAVTLGNGGNPMPITVNGSQSWINNSNNLLTVVNNISLGGNTLAFAGSGNLSLTGTMDLSNGGLQNNTVGVTTLTGANNSNSATVLAINSGTLAIGGAGQLGGGNYAGTVSNYGLLNYNSSANQTFSGAIGGGGGLAKNRSGRRDHGRQQHLHRSHRDQRRPAQPRRGRKHRRHPDRWASAAQSASAAARCNTPPRTSTTIPSASALPRASSTESTPTGRTSPGARPWPVPAAR